MTKKEPKKRKRIIRRRRKKGTGAKLYFTSDTQAAIRTYLEEDAMLAKEKVYRESIMPAFSKLVENLINIYGFVGIESYEELKSDCVTFLFETMKKFDHSRGTNAFSYFNVVAKNWLIIKSKQRVNKLKSTVSVDDSESLATTELKILKERQVVQSQDEILIEGEKLVSILKVVKEIKKRLKNENEHMCINAIITIFENIDELDLFNKTAILLYIKELSGLSQKQLTTSLHAIKRHYREIKGDREFDLFN